MADAGLLPDPWRLVEAFEAEAAALREVPQKGGE
jgi:hypothetical protein